MKSELKIKGKFRVQHIRNGQLIGEYDFHNAITDVGVNYLLETAFHDGAKTTPWYIGLINSGATEDPGDTMASHGGWTESTIYDETYRQTWVCNTADGRAIANTTIATFTMNDTGTIYGLFVASSHTKSEGASLLWCTGAFSAPRPVVAADTIKVIYSVDA